jgi:DNA invertase Pin-like site-specific DNA recombinase
VKVIGYVRVSDVADRAGERFISVAEQREAIQRFVTAKGYELVDIVEDLNESGGTLDRPGLKRVLERLDQGEAEAIAAPYLSRLSRRVVEGLGLVQEMTEKGQYVLVADLDLDTSTPIGRTILTVLLAFAELELEQRRGSYAAAQRRAMERGVYPGNTPLGYLRDEDGRMTPNPKTAPVIRKLYERRVAGDSWTVLARMLDQEMPREDGQTWRPSTVADMLTTSMNIGRLERTVGGERILVEDAHEPLVPRALWEAVVNGKRPANGPVRRPEPAILAGLVRCSGCGGPMSRGGQRRKNAAGEWIYFDHYACLTRCDKQAKMSVKAADRFVLEQTIERLGGSKEVRASRRKDGDTKRLEEELERAETERATYLRAISAADVGEAAFAQGARERQERVVAAQQKLAKAAAQLRVAGPSYTEVLARLESSESDGERNLLLRTLIEGVVVQKSGQAGRRGDPADRLRIVFRSDDLAEDGLQLGQDSGVEGASVAA